LFIVSVGTTFQASHQLRLASGTKEEIHSHDWAVEAAVSARQLDKTGLVFDFNRLRQILDDVVCGFNNRQLEEFGYFQKVNSSAENVAKYVFENVAGRLPERVHLEYIEVTETSGCRARYTG